VLVDTQKSTFRLYTEVTMKSLSEILQSAGEIAGKIESSDTMASTKSIVRGLTQNFNKGYQNSKAPKQLDLFSEDYESFQARMRQEADDV
jgi:hypothetical protein